MASLILVVWGKLIIVDESQQEYVEVQSSLLVLQIAQGFCGHSGCSGQCRLNGILRVDTNLSQ